MLLLMIVNSTMNSTMLAPCCSMILQPTPHRPPAGDKPCPAVLSSFLDTIVDAGLHHSWCHTSGVPVGATGQMVEYHKKSSNIYDSFTKTHMWMSTNCVWIRMCLFFTNILCLEWLGCPYYGSAVSKSLQGPRQVIPGHKSGVVTPPRSPLGFFGCQRRKGVNLQQVPSAFSCRRKHTNRNRVSTFIEIVESCIWILSVLTLKLPLPIQIRKQGHNMTQHQPGFHLCHAISIAITRPRSPRGSCCRAMRTDRVSGIHGTIMIRQFTPGELIIANPNHNVKNSWMGHQHQRKEYFCECMCFCRYADALPNASKSLKMWPISGTQPRST